MSVLDEIGHTDIEGYLLHRRADQLVRFVTCGSVDDGKSTLIGRLLYESKVVFEDHLAALERDSARFGTQGGRLDLALLLDGLLAEREQGITIDVAYRFFASAHRRFIVADTPGHDQYTRNMVTGASTADAAVVLIDARKGVLTQTRRHSYLIALLGVRSVALAVNKMDLVGYSQGVFSEIEQRYRDFAAQIGVPNVTAIPISALDGDNVVVPSVRTPWFAGPTLTEFLESVPVDSDRAQMLPFRMAVQWINRPHPDFRGVCGMISAGVIRPGERVRVQPSGIETYVSRIVTYDGDLECAVAGESVTLELVDAVDVSRGDLLTDADDPAQVADQFEAKLVWMAKEPLLPERPYLFRIGTRTVSGAVTRIKHAISVDTLEPAAAHQLELNSIGVCNVALDQVAPFDPFEENHDTGGFVVIDKVSNATVGAGMLAFALRRSHSVHPQHLDLDKAARAALTRQKPCVLWFTGLSGAGKSTISNLVELKLHALGHHTYLLDGDNVRGALNKDLGFSDADRVENIRRVAEVAKLMVDAGLIVLVSFISPFRSERRFARGLVEPGEFIEIFVDAPVDVAERRDPKGLYRKARRGELKRFTGIDSPYEPPTEAEAVLDTVRLSAEEAADRIITMLRKLDRLTG